MNRTHTQTDRHDQTHYHAAFADGNTNYFSFYAMLYEYLQVCLISAMASSPVLSEYSSMCGLDRRRSRKDGRVRSSIARVESLIITVHTRSGLSACSAQRSDWDNCHDVSSYRSTPVAVSHCAWKPTSHVKVPPDWTMWCVHQARQVTLFRISCLLVTIFAQVYLRTTNVITVEL